MSFDRSNTLDNFLLEPEPSMLSLNRANANAPKVQVTSIGASKSPYMGAQHQQHLPQQPPLLTVGSFGTPYPQKKSVDQIVEAIANQIKRTPKISNINEFFLPYDGHEQRAFESWELQVMFMDIIDQEDADLLVNTAGSRQMSGEVSLPYKTLLMSVSTKIPTMQPGMPNRQSVFANKFKSPQITQHLNALCNFLKQRGYNNFITAYNQFFTSNYITQADFQNFIRQSGLNVQEYERNMIFSYFCISNETMISKISFIQALKALSNSPSGSQLETINSMGTQGHGTYTSQSSYSTVDQSNVPLQNFLQTTKNFMITNNGLSFEGLLQRFNIPNQRYIETYKIEELCLNLGLRLQPFELNQLINAFDDDKMGKVKTESLRYKLEYLQTTVPQINTPGIGQSNYPSNTTSTIQNQSSGFHIQMQPINTLSANNAKQLEPPSPRLSPRRRGINGEHPLLRAKKVLENIETQPLVQEPVHPLLQQQQQLTQPLYQQQQQQQQFPLNNNNMLNNNMMNNNMMNNNNVGIGNLQQNNYPQQYNNQGFNQGLNTGFNQGLNQGLNQGINQGYNQTYNTGLNQGYQAYTPHQQQYQIEPLLEKIRNFLTRNKITNLRKIFNISYIMNKEVTNVEEFYTVLTMKGFIDLTSEEASFLGSHYILQIPSISYQTQKYIDLDKFENEIYAAQAPMLQLHQEQSISYGTLSKIYDTIRKYIVMKGGNILKFFSDADLNKDNYISKAELKIVIERLGHVGLTDNDMNKIFFLFDQNQDGRISYGELCKQFAEFANTKAIKDPSHWSFYIFESIRIACTNNQVSLAQVFGIHEGMVKTFREKIPISKDQVIQGLARLFIPFPHDYEKKFFELLDADHSTTVDFVHLAELVGLDYQPVELERIATEYITNPLQTQQAERMRKFYRQLFNVLQRNQITINILRFTFQNADLEGLGQIGLQEFMNKIREIDRDNKIDYNLITDVSQRFAVQGRMVQMFNYIDFLNKVNFEMEKYKIVNLVFQSLQAALQISGNNNLADFFKKFDPTGGMRQFDQNMLQDTFKKFGTYLNKHQMEMMLLEYGIQQGAGVGSNLRLDFAKFESDYREFCQGNSELNAYQHQRRMFGQQGISNQISIRAQTPVIKQILTKIGNYIDSYTIKFGQLLLEHDLTRTGILNIPNFTDILTRGLRLSNDESQHLIFHYDPNGRQQVKIQDFLTDLKDYIKDVQKRLDIINIATELGQNTGPTMGMPQDPHQIFQRFQKDFEEMQKAIIVKGSNTFKWFEGYSSMPGRQVITRNDFRSAIKGLYLSQITDTDIDTIFDAIDTRHSGQIEIYAIDETIRKYSVQDSGSMEDEILERIVRAFNGDDNFILRELSQVDQSRRGLLDIPIFVNFFVKNSPQHIRFNQNDLQYLGKKYVNPSQFSPNQVDINIFHSDFKRMRQLKGIQQGYYYGVHAINQDHLLYGQGGNQINDIGAGYRNPMLPGVTSKNTQTEMTGMQNPQFTINVGQNYLEDIMKGTYLSGFKVLDYFQRYQQANGNMQETDFNRAIEQLQVGWTFQSAENVFAEIDRAFNGIRTRRMIITPKQIDEAIAFGCKKGINLRHEMENYDTRMTSQLSIDNLVDLLLNKLRIPQMMKFDIQFLAKKYILTVPNQVIYTKFLEDFEGLQKTAFAGMGNFKTICDFIRKACIIQKMTVDEYFNSQMRNKNMMTLQEFQYALQNLSLIPDICTINNIDQIFNEIDTQKTQRVTSMQISSYIGRYSTKNTRELQEEIIDEISAKVNAKFMVLDNIFKNDDRSGRGLVTQQSFKNILMTQFAVKEIDARLIGLRYFEYGDEVNYKKFAIDVQNKARDSTKHSGQQPQPGFGFRPEDNSQHQQRLKNILVRINDYIQQRNITLNQYLSQHERGMSTGTIQQSAFLQVLDQLGFPLSNDEKFFISENYLVFQSQPPQINYLKFQEDLKLFASGPSKNSQALTVDQRKFYTQFGQHMKDNNKINSFAKGVLDADYQKKGYLPRQTLEQICRTNEYKFIAKQFDTMFSALDTNRAGEFNYRQLFEILLGTELTQKLLSGGAIGGQVQQIQQVQFVMPQQPIAPMNNIMAQVGRKLIMSNINYEEEIKRKIGYQQATQVNPKATENELLDVLTTCKVQLNNEERIELQAFVMNKRDQQGFIPILEFLQAIGLPAQTLGTRGQKQLPKKILSAQDLQLAQSIIIKLRNHLNAVRQKPADVFEKCKQSPQDLSIPLVRFKLILSTEFGAIGKQINEDQTTLLAYYLTQEVPGEISYKKLYLAFTLTEKDPPLQQEGADKIKEYENKLREQAKKGVPMEVQDLIYYIKHNQLQLNQVFKTTQRGLISSQEFTTCIKDCGFQPKDIQKLIECLDVKGTRTSVSLDKLKEYISKASPEGRGQITKQMAIDRFQGFDPKVRQYMQKISDYMKRNNMTLQRMYDEIDINKDGSVDKMEFVSRIGFLNIPGIHHSDLGMIFDAIDINNDGTLSMNEFALFLEGAKVTREQRMQDLDPKLVLEMQQQIDILFQEFDENRDGVVTADEIYKSMMAIGQRISLVDAQNMIKEVDQNGDGRIDKNEFTRLILPKMKLELLQQEDSIEDLRAMFLDADIDHSGTLSIDEIYGVLQNMKAEVSVEDLVELMNEIDVDRDGTLDIDEFIALMTMGDDLQFRSAQAKNTLINIKRARKLKPQDFFKCFKNLPMNFIPSFFNDKWTKAKKNLPSSVFMPQIDPTTMLYKDLYPVLSENLAPNQNQRAFQPRVRPLITELGCQLLLEGAEGVPLPANNSGFDRTQIVKRAVRVGLYDTVKKDFIINAVQVSALYNQVDEDIWKFNAWKENGTNPVLFRTSNKDEIVKPHIFLIFEMVIYVNFGDKVQEISCGWCQLDLHLLDRQMTHKLPIKGGSPNAEVLIKDSDVHTNRTGLQLIKKVVTKNITSQLTVSVRPHKSFTEETRFHLELLPSTCLIQKRLLYFVSGFRNYVGEKLLKQSSLSSFKHPEGDVIISSFPKILDNPDMCEQIVSIWSEDVWSGLNATQKKNVELIMLKSKEYIQKLYPVIYSDEFKFKESNTTSSAAGDQYLMRKREELIKSALRFGNQQAKVKVDKPVEMLTTFKPFTVKELEFQVWDTTQAKKDRYLKQYGDMGLLSGGQHNASDNMSAASGLGRANNLQGLSTFNNQMGGNLGSANFGSQGNALQPLDQATFGQANNLNRGQSHSLGSALNNAFGK